MASQCSLFQLINSKHSFTRWSVSAGNPITVNFPGGTMTHCGSSALAAYNADQKLIINTYDAAQPSGLDKDALYLFCIDNVDGKAGVAGFMPLQRQCGFIYGSPELNIVAHELGHGAFNLYHTFSSENYIAKEQSTDNLMDYKGGTELWKCQWENVQDPQRVWMSWAQGEKEGEATTSSTPIVTPVWIIPDINNGLFVTPSGYPMWLSGIDSVAVMNLAEAGTLPALYPTTVLYGFKKDGIRYFAGFKDDSNTQRIFNGYYNTSPNAAVDDFYTDTQGITKQQLANGSYEVLLWNIDTKKFDTHRVDNNKWYSAEPQWNGYTAAGVHLTVVDSYNFIPCSNLLREYKDSPIMESRVLKTAILKNPCVLEGPTLHLGEGLQTETEFMKGFNMVFGTMVNVAFIPAIAEVGGVALLEYGKQQLTKASIAAVLDMSLQSVCIYLEGDENMNMTDVLSKIDYYQVAVSAGEGAIDNIYTDLTVPLYDALMKDGRLKDELTPGDFLKDYALGVTINLLTRGIADGHFSKYYKRMVAAVKKGNLENKLAKIGLSAENRKAFSDLMGGMTQRSLQRFEALTQQLRTFPVDGTATDLSRFADELDAVADHYPNKSIDELVAAFGCFTAATTVATPGGLRPIADIQTGDTVMSYNHAAQRTEPRVVANLKNYAAKALVILSLSTGQQIEATPTHPFFANGRYTPASQLAPGDTLTAPNGHKVLLQAVQPLDTVATVYNLTVAHNSNYFVGNPGVLVHNDCMMALLNAPIYKSLVDKLDKLTPELKAAFMADFEKAGKEVLDALNLNDGMLDAWKSLYQNVSTTAPLLRKNVKLLENIASLSRKFPDSNWGAIISNAENKSIEALFNGLKKLEGKEGLSHVLADLSVSGNKYLGARYVVDYASSQSDEFISFIKKFEAVDYDDLGKRRYDILIDWNGKPINFELKNWVNWHSSTFKEQFFKDLIKTTDINSVKWKFNNTGTITPSTLKDYVLGSIAYKSDGVWKPLNDFMSSIDEATVKKLFPKEKFEEGNYAEIFIKKIQENDVFNILFEVTKL